MARFWLVPLVAAALLLCSIQASAMCSFTQTCYDGSLDSGCHAVPLTQEPFPADGWALPVQCPRYKDSGCCTEEQNKYLFINFILIQSAFGTANSGCDACSQNLKRFWCEFTCSPNQADFVHPLGLVNVTDPVSHTPDVTVLEMTMDVSTSFACEFYDSCKNTLDARITETMHTCDGFLDYQGQYQAIGRGNYINFNYTNSPTALQFDADKCTNFTDQTTGEQASCPCGSCAASCASARDTSGLERLNELASIDPLHGADWLAIGIVYGSIFVLSAALVFYRWMRDSRSSSAFVSAAASPKGRGSTAPPTQGFADVLPDVSKGQDDEMITG